jgi:hypothetical protein
MFVVLSMFLGSFPFVLILSIAQNTARRFIPSNDDHTLGYGKFLHALAMILGLIGVFFAIAIRIVRHKSDVELCLRLKKMPLYIAAIVNFIMLIVLIIGILFFNNTTNALEECSKATLETIDTLPHCKIACAREDFILSNA